MNTEPEVSGRVSALTRNLLWAQSAGRCQYCNKPLIGDLHSGNDKLIRALVAHIVSAKPNGPRGDAVRSPLLVDDIGNLMLLCYEHHRLIDIEDEAGHPEELLLAMKAAHETRIEIQTSLTEDRQTQILTYGAPIGVLEAPLSYSSVRMAVLPERYPAGGRDRIHRVLGPDVPIWSIAADEPHNDIVRRAEDLRTWRRLLRRTFNQIKVVCGGDAEIHVFPALPVSATIETGRIWMPKADLPLVIYDENRTHGGFLRTIDFTTPVPLAA